MNKLALLLLALLFSCTGNQTTSNLREIYGREIVLPADGRWRILARDTTVVLGADKPRIVVYYNSMGCTSCRMKELVDWREMMAEPEVRGVEFVFVFATGDELRDLTFSLRQYKFDYAVLCDVNKEFERENLLPKDEAFHCFLVDKSGKAVLVGSPVYNPSMWSLYKRRIAELQKGVSD